MRTTRIITVLLAALLTAAILAGPAAAVPTDVISGGSTSPDQAARRSAHSGILGLRLGLRRHRGRCRDRSVRDRARRNHRHAPAPTRTAPVGRHPLITTTRSRRNLAAGTAPPDHLMLATSRRSWNGGSHAAP